MKIKFVPGTKDIEDLVPCPEPSKGFIPEWYKQIPGGKDIVNVKKCVPFLDSFTHGYIQKTWADIHVENNENLDVSFDSKVNILSYRQQSNMPIDGEFYSREFVWQRPWSIVLPEGFSALITHPLNRMDLPFLTLSAIVDFDKAIHAPVGNIPFYIKNGFVGTIPAGTPMFQIIPIKRESWELEKQSHSKEFWGLKIKEKSSIADFYKKKIWQKKSFD